MAIVHDPDNSFVIKELWAFCSKDEGGEGLCAFPLEGTPLTMPMIAADKRRVNDLRNIAENLGKMTKKRIVLKKFKLVGTEEIIK